MGRKKIKIERLPEHKREVTYSKRRKGIVKKAHDIATLCDIEVALIMFSCTGQLDHFCSRPSIWKILQRFIQKVQSMSEIETENLQISQDVINTINNLAGQYEVTNQSRAGVLRSPDKPHREEIKRENDKIDCMLLQLREIMMHPGRKAFNSEQEFRKLVQGLHSVHLMIANRKEHLESHEHAWNTSYNTSHSTQNVDSEMLMQQPQTRFEAGTWITVQGGEHMQQQGVQIFGMEDPSSLSVPPQMLMQQLQAPPPRYGICAPLQGRENMQQQEVPAFEMEDLSLSPESLFSALQNVDISTFCSEQIESEPGTGPYKAPDDAPQWHENTSNRNGKRDRSN